MNVRISTGKSVVAVNLLLAWPGSLARLSEAGIAG